MSKELIVSTGKHETRVAILEDDQLVEIFHEREKEYSLAGSIHKGRVTRVLPGMQSAFVDIGLERDAFLYVSDFFEDNEEYDKVVTSVEDKVLTLDRVSQSAPPPAAPAAPEAPPSRDVESGTGPQPVNPVASGRDRDTTVSREGVVTESPAAPPPPSAAPASPADQRRDDHDRRGRRGRRRRGGKGRGLPESKFYSPAASTPEQSVAPQKIALE